MTTAEWGFWIAAATLVAGTGKFLDDHHIKAATKSLARDFLVRWFVWLDSTSVPDLGLSVLRPLAALLRWRVVVTLFFLLGGSLAITTALYLWRVIYGPDPGNYLGYVTYWLAGGELLFWGVFLAAILLPAVAGSWVMAIFVARAARAKTSWERAALLVSAVVLGPAISIVGVLPLALTSISPYGAGLLGAALVSPALPLLLVCLVLLLMALRTVVRVTQWTLLKVFDSASSPSASPFAYASSLLALLILCAKVAQSAL